MFVDASAFVAILTDEPEREALDARIASAPHPITSALAIYETALGIARKKIAPPQRAVGVVHGYLEERRVSIVPIGSEEADLALQAHDRFGKGHHPARLNMGDCFAYACARRHGVPLLYKGDDFALTDIEAPAPR